MDFPNRPPGEDGCETQFLHFERRGSIATLTVDRPHLRNAMTPATYLGGRYAVDRVNQSDDLSALAITGIGDLFVPDGDLGGDQEGSPTDLARLLHVESVPFGEIRQSRKINAHFVIFDRRAIDESLHGTEAVEGFQAFEDHRHPTWGPIDSCTDGRL